MKWKKQKVTLACRNGAQTTTAHVLKGLAVHKPLDANGRQRGTAYVITHIASGLAMTSHKPMDCLDGAKACVEHLASLGIDWTLANDALLRDHRPVLKTVPREIDRFRDYNLRRTLRI